MREVTRQKPKRSFVDVVDGAIFAVFPRWGENRRRIRRKDMLHKRVVEFTEDRMHRRERLSAYEAADTDRFRGQKWLTSRLSQNSIIDVELETLQDRAKDLYRNDAYASSAINGRVTHVVGTGYTLQSRVTGQGDEMASEEDLTLRKQLERVYKKWAKAEAITSKQRMYQRCKGIYGEGILVMSDFGTADKPVPLHVQVISPERLSTPFASKVLRVVDGSEVEVSLSSEDFNRTRQGIRFDDQDKPTHYYIRTSLPNDNKDIRYEWREYPADRVCHSFEEIFPGQIRGIPWLTPAMADLKDIKDFKEAHLISEQVAACFSAFVKRADDAYSAADNNATDTASDGQRLEELEPGLIQYLNEGEEVQMANPNRPGDTLAPFMEWYLRTIGAAIGYPYELLANDYSKTTYSSGRLSLIGGRITFGCWQKQDIEAWSHVYERFVEECVVVGAVDIDPTEFAQETARFLLHYYQPDGWPWIDPVKEVQADSDAVDAGLATKTSSLAARGCDFDETQETRYQEQASEIELSARLEKHRLDMETKYGVEIDPVADTSRAAQSKKETDRQDREVKNNRTKEEKEEVVAA